MTTTTTTTTTTTPTPPTGPAIEVLAAKDPGARLSNQRFRLRDSDALVGPYAHLAAERERLSRLTWDHFDVQRLGATVGAVLTGLDLASSLPDIVIEDIRRALHEYKVIFFRDQPMTSAQHVAFARRFGSLEIHPFIPSNTGEPELVRFAKSSEVGGYENSWHHDVTWRATPSMGAVLHAIQVPDAGGDTLFSDMYAAYDGLADDVKSRIDTMEAEHDYMLTFGRQVPPDKQAETRQRYPIVRHPVVATHDVTGRRHLYVNRNFVLRLVCDDPDAASLLSHLCRQAEFPEYQCRFHWEPDSVAFWDNRAVQHYAASDYYPSIRVMERASVVGEQPR